MNVNPGKTEFTEAEFADLRTRVRARMSEVGKIQAQVGREAEIPAASLSQFLSGTYTAEPGRTNIAAALVKWLNALEISELLSRAAPKAPDYIPLKGSSKVMGILTYARVNGELVVVASHPGLSKTSSALQFRQDNPRTWYAPMDSTTRGAPVMLLEILAAMGEPDAKGPPNTLMRRICAIARGAEGLLIIDEAQHLSDQAIEALRAINDRARIGVAILGNEGIYSQIGVAGGRIQFAQVASRVGHREFIKRAISDDAAELAKAWAATNDEVIGLPEVKYCQDIAQRPGGLRNIEKTFRKALFLARTQREPLDLSHLQGAFAQLAGDAA